MIKSIAILMVTAAGLFLPVISTASTLQVSVPEIVVPGGTIGTEFAVPISIFIPDGMGNEGVARLYVRLVSSDSTNMIAPVASGDKVTTAWAPAVTAFDAKFGSVLRDLDNDGDLDALDTAVVDLGSNTNKNIGIGGSVQILTQTWKFIGNPASGTNYTLAVQFPATRSRHYASGSPVAFTGQQSVNGSVRISGVDIQGMVTLQDLIAGAEVGRTVTIEIRNAGILVETLNLTLAAGGTYAATGTGTSPGTYDLYFKSPHWLAKKIADIALAAGTNTVNATLLNGDCDEDNEVTSADLAVILSAMDTLPEDGNWSPTADLNGDIQVTSADLSISLSNMDQVGDQ